MNRLIARSMHINCKIQKKIGSASNSSSGKWRIFIKNFKKEVKECTDKECVTVHLNF